MRVSASRLIRAEPHSVYEIVTRFERMPDRSPEQQRFEWLSGNGAEVGAAFRGWNRVYGVTWWTNGWITRAEPPTCVEFETSSIYGDRTEHTNRWSYVLERRDDGTLVTETLEVLRMPIHLKVLGPVLKLRERQIRTGMVRTLERLADECELSAG